MNRVYVDWPDHFAMVRGFGWQLDWRGESLRCFIENHDGLKAEVEHLQGAWRRGYDEACRIRGTSTKEPQ